ncbi:MAG: hypothetical protein ACTSRG_01550 [Candidatus Helarchaeota archaeon]
MEVHKLLLKNMEIFFSSIPVFYLHDPLTLSTVTHENQFVTLERAAVSFDSFLTIYKKCHESNVRISINANYTRFIDFINKCI